MLCYGRGITHGFLFLEEVAMRLSVDLAQDEANALLALARKERRHPREQAALVIIKELERLGLLQPIPPLKCRQPQEVRA